MTPECFANEPDEPTCPTILVVDDTEANIDILVDLLGDDYEVMAALDGETALEISLEESPDLILLDIMMPGMDGYEVCRRLKNDARTRHIPIIFVTAKIEVEDETKGLELGAVDYIAKPISPPVVLARIKTHLSLKNSRERLQQAYDLIAARTRRMEKELEMGRRVQMSMVPHEFPPFPDHPEIDLYASLDPALETCGDFYDWFALPDGNVCVLIADVSGKGVPASLFMSMTRALIRSHAAPGKLPGDIIGEVNNALAAENTETMFTTLFLAVMDPETGKVLYSNAGHNPPLLRRAAGMVETLPTGHGPAAGACEDMEYGTNELALAPGDTLLMFTDGVTEARSPDDDLFSDERLEALITETRCDSARDLVDAIRTEVSAFEACTGRTDDITIVALRYAGKQ